MPLPPHATAVTLAATWVALLRGINVGTAKRVAMSGLREALSALGYDDVRTYLQSGNAVFRAHGTELDVAQRSCTSRSWLVPPLLTPSPPSTLASSRPMPSLAGTA